MSLFKASLILLAFGCSASVSWSQTAAYYAIESIDQGDAIRRGTAGSNGIPQGELIIAPNTKYRVWYYQPDTKLFGHTEFTTPSAGRRFEFPAPPLRLSDTRDRDFDGLTDEAEFVIGTSPTNPDSDNDLITDGAEIEQGLDPLDGQSAATGIIVSVDTPGGAKDVCAIDNIAIVADSNRGVTVFNIFNRMSATIIGQIDTPGQALAVGCTGRFIVVADGVSGLQIIDFSDPPNAQVVRAEYFAAPTRSVAAAAGVAFVGLDNGYLFAVDVTTGDVLANADLGGNPVKDVALSGDLIYTLQDGEMRVLELQGSVFNQLGQIGGVGNGPSPSFQTRLEVGGGLAFATSWNGFHTIDVTNPASPSIVGTLTTGALGWRQVVPNGSGLAVAVVGPNTTNDPSDNVSVYDVRNPASLNTFQIELPTPSSAQAAAIFNGLAYVADSDRGLQVINFTTSDVNGVAPTIALSTNAAANMIEEGKTFGMTAAVTDDVQVRNVEFYVDGRRVLTDGNFPFEHRFVTPTIAALGRNTFLVRALASDTAGAKTWSTEIQISIAPDTTAPLIVGNYPADSDVIQATDSFRIQFNEEIDVASLNTGTQVTSAGADGVFGTGDDLVLNRSVQWSPGGKTATVNLDETPVGGLYRLTMAGVTDLAGNAIAPLSVEFRVAGDADSDNDGVPDDFEPGLGLIVGDPDSDDNGTLDGDEDNDNDMLTNRSEFVMQTNPDNPDTDNNGIIDGLEDRDDDGLIDSQEFIFASNPFDPETDGDGISDGAEVIDSGTDPNDPASSPVLFFGSTASVQSQAAPGVMSGNSLASPTTTTRQVVRFESGTGGEFQAPQPVETRVMRYHTGDGKPFATSRPVVEVENENP